MTWGQLAVIANSGRRPAALSRARPAQPVARAALDVIPTVGTVTRVDAERVPAMHRGVDLIASTVGSFPLVKWRDRAPVPSTFLAQPEANFPASYTIAQTVRDLIYDGVAYWIIADHKNAEGEILRPARDAQGFPANVYRPAPWEVVGPAIGGGLLIGNEPVAGADVIVFLGPDSDWSATNGLVSRGLLSTAARTIAAAARLEEAAARYAWNEVPYFMLQMEDGAEELEEDEVEDLLGSWEEARRRRSTAYLPAGLKANAVTGPDPEKLQLNESRQYIASEIARHLNLPPRYVGASSGDSLTYNSQAADRRDLIDLGLRPWMTAVESVLSMPHVTPGTQVVKLDTSDFAKSDLKEQSQILTAYLSAGVIDVDEARAQLQLAPRTEAAP